MIRSVQGKQSRLLPVTLRNDYMVMARSPSPHPPKTHLLTLSKDQKSVKEVSFNRLHFPNVIKSTFTIIIRNSKLGTKQKYIYICMEFLLRSRIIGTRKCVHFSFFCERRQFVSLSSKRDSYYRDARERGGKKKKKNLYFFIKFLIFLTSASFSGFFLTILFHDRTMTREQDKFFFSNYENY